MLDKIRGSKWRGRTDFDSNIFAPFLTFL
jgi:hypothetical protein